MRKLIDVKDLRVGMYLSGFDRAWINTPFLTHRFLIDDEEQIRKIRGLDILHVYIDTDLGLDVSEQDEPRHTAEAVETQQYIPVELSSLKTCSKLPFDLYRNTGKGKEQLLGKGEELSPALRKSLVGADVRLVHVRQQDEAAYVQYLESLRVARDGQVAYSHEEFRRYNREKGIHFPIEREMLTPGTNANFSIYVKRGFFYDPLLTVDRDSEAELTERHVTATGELAILQEDIPHYQAYIARRLRDSQGDARIAAIVTRESANVKLRQVFNNHRDEDLVRGSAETIVHDLMGVIMSRRGAFVSLLNLHAQDMYTYTHSLNVAVLAVSLGSHIGLDERKLFELGIGCVLHDIGKVLVPSDILNKPDRLTTREMSVMKKHVLQGYEMVREFKDLPERSMFPIMQHHETLTGTGYPSGLKGPDLDPFGKIAAIVDRFDALTTDRPYKKAFSPYYALAAIAREIDDYDPELFSAFVRMLGLVSQEDQPPTL